jgi:hypothetical protein
VINAKGPTLGGIAALLAGNAINVKSFGAKGDGVTDDTAAIQAAIDDASVKSNQVSFPSGTYKISAPINVPTGAHLVGAGWTNSIIKLVSTSACLNLPAHSYRQTIENMQITTDGTMVDQAIKINDNCNNWKISHVRIIYPNVNSFTTGILIGVTCYTGTIEDIEMYRCVTGISVGDVANYISFRRCSVTYCTTGIIFTGGGRGRVIDSCDIELNQDGVKTTNNGDLQIVNTYFDANSGYDVWCAFGTNALDNLYMAGNQFYKDVSGTYVRLNMAQNSTATFIGNNFVGGGTGQTYTAIDSQGFSQAYSIQDHFQGMSAPSPSQTLSIVSKGVIFPVKLATGSAYQSTSFTVSTTSTTSLYRLDATSGNIVITLPDLVPSGGAPYSGFSIELSRWDASANNVSFSVTNGSLFNNRTLAAADRYKIFRLIYNRVATGTNEWILLGG